MPLLFYFLKIGAVVFGSGYVLLAVLRADLVVRLHWLTDGQLLDAIAVSQATPGPFFTVSTFIGYLLGGWKGAALATMGMFVPAVVYVAATAKYLPKLRKSPIAGAFLDGVNAAAVSLMATVSWQFARAAFVNVPAIVLGLVSLFVVFAVKRIPPGSCSAERLPVFCSGYSAESRRPTQLQRTYTTSTIFPNDPAARTS